MPAEAAGAPAGVHPFRGAGSAGAGKSVSPSLSQLRRGLAPAFEMKFLLDEATARAVEALLAPHLQLDPHADPALENAYRIASLYCDTAAFDVFHRLGWHRYRKYRVRRYGDSAQLYVERKTVTGMQVRKRRAAIEERDLARLGVTPNGAHDDWPGEWYCRQRFRRALAPVCRIAYLRRAYFGESDGELFRVTFDRQVRGALVQGWSFAAMSAERELLAGLVVLECKFRGTLPACMKAAIQELLLTPRGVSKYRHCIEAFGLAQPREARSNA